MKIALLCSGLGRVRRGHEVFAETLFGLLRDDLEITLFKGGGASSLREHVIDHLPRDSPLLDGMRLPVSAKWQSAAKEVERMRIEGETFAYASLGRLLEGGFDIIHCLEQEVCSTLYAHRHLFAHTPRFLFSNGGALAGPELPPCDFVQEYTAHNLARSAREKSFLIPHGVDVDRFRPGLTTDFRARYGIPEDALVVISVGSIGYWHKRMDYVVREVAQVPAAWLIIVGQESADTPAIKALGRETMGERAIFTTLPHEQLPQVYAAADVFTLGSVFETFGIAYIEAMAMGLPVVCTNHANQRAIVQTGVFIDVQRPGALSSTLRATSREQWRQLGQRAREIAVRDYSLLNLKADYLREYSNIANTPVTLPRSTGWTRIAANVRNSLRRARLLAFGALK